jgi:hypothetical protein
MYVKELMKVRHMMKKKEYAYKIQLKNFNQYFKIVDDEENKTTTISLPETKFTYEELEMPQKVYLMGVMMGDEEEENGRTNGQDNSTIGKNESTTRPNKNEIEPNGNENEPSYNDDNTPTENKMNENGN